MKALADRGAQVEIRTVGRRFHLAERLSDASRFDRIVVAGGDGTISTVAGFLKNSGIPIVAYPGGTANLLARNLSIPSNPGELAEITLHGDSLPTDLGELEYHRYFRRDAIRRRFLKQSPMRVPAKIYFSILAGYGFAAQLMSHAQLLKSKWGQAAYWFSAFWNLFPRKASFRLLLDDREIHAEGIGILIVNFEKIQFDLKIVPENRAEDGKFEIAVVKARSLFGLLPILWGAICQRLGLARRRVPEVMETYSASRLEVSSRPPLKLQFDGEILKRASSFRVRVCPRAALFITGENSGRGGPPSL